VPPSLDQPAKARRKPVRLERLFDHIKSADFRRFDRQRNAGSAGHDDDRRRIIARIEISQNLEPRTARHVNIEEDAGRRAQSRHGREGLLVREAGYAVALRLQHKCEQIAERRIIIENKNLVAVRHSWGSIRASGRDSLNRITIYIYLPMRVNHYPARQDQASLTRSAEWRLPLLRCRLVDGVTGLV
jgi:hypothetical protein